MSLKFDDAAADNGPTQISQKLSISPSRSNISWGRVLVAVHAGEKVEQASGSERLDEMSLGQLLYHALVGEEAVTDEPA